MQPTIPPDHLRGHLEMLILAILDRGPAHGLEIMRRLEAGGSGMLKLKEGSLYPALYRLEAARQVQAAWEKHHKGRGARRRIYRLTPKGGRRLQQGRGQWDSFVSILGGILAKPARAGG